jgi:hypothetical protein
MSEDIAYHYTPHFKKEIGNFVVTRVCHFERSEAKPTRPAAQS